MRREIFGSQNQPIRSGYLPSLDGWRAIAIAGVLLTHSLKWSIAGYSLEPYQNIGGTGVSLFFAISGILITTRILEEESLCGFFDIKKFYIRRIFRIQPAAWVYLAAIAILLGTGCITTQWNHWFGALGMYENFLYQGTALDYKGFFVGHFWSLAVEEHFYILLSLFLLTVRKKRLKILATIFLGLLAFKIYAAGRGYLSDATIRRTYYQLPKLVYAAAFAVAIRKPQLRDRIIPISKPWIVFVVTALLILGQALLFRRLDPHSPDFYSVCVPAAVYMLCDYLFALWVLSTMLHPASLACRFLELQPLRWVGRISYSLYLWHVLFFSTGSSKVRVTLPLLRALSGEPTKYLIAIAVAAASYYLIEKPLIRLGHRLAPPASPGRPELADDSVLEPAPTPAV